jgi:hypothetical protein
VPARIGSPRSCAPFRMQPTALAFARLTEREAVAGRMPLRGMLEEQVKIWSSLTVN